MRKDKMTSAVRSYIVATNNLMHLIKELPSYGDDCTCPGSVHEHVSIADYDSCVGSDMEVVCKYCIKCGGSIV